MPRENPLWGAPRIQAELTKLGIEASEPTVAKYMVRLRKPPSQTWLTFLHIHKNAMASIDFSTVPTAMLRILYVFLVLSHDRRKVLYMNVTEHPSSMWTGRQLLQAFPWDTAPKYLLRDRDSIYGPEFERAADNLGFEQVVTAPRSAWRKSSPPRPPSYSSFFISEGLRKRSKNSTCFRYSAIVFSRLAVPCPSSGKISESTTTPLPLTASRTCRAS